jgi:hypothetical protein
MGPKYIEDSEIVNLYTYVCVCVCVCVYIHTHTHIFSLNFKMWISLQVTVVNTDLKISTTEETNI